MSNSEGQRKYASRLDTCRQVSVFFRNTGTMDLSLKINGSTALSQSFGPEGQIREWSVGGRIGTARWTVNAADSAVFYGVAMDDFWTTFPCAECPVFPCVLFLFRH